MPSTASFSGKRMLIEINKVMDSMEAKHRSAFLDSIQKLTGNIELLAIVNDIRSGAITKIDGGVLARIDKVQVDMASLTQISRQAMGLGGKITAKTVGLEGAFDVTNEMAIDAARTISANLANVLKKSVARTIGSIIQDAVSGVDSPYETVKRIQSEIGLTPAHAQSVKIYRQNLINSGVDKARAIKQAEAYAKRLLKYRARTIARTEVSIAVNVGQLEFWKQMLSRGSLPANTKRVWIAELDGKVCGVCKPLNGELASIDGYWVTAGGSFDIPHAHPNCRCTSGLVFPTPFSKSDDAGYESWVISKGESAGHPFRGNQYTEGISGGIKGGHSFFGVPRDVGVYSVSTLLDETLAKATGIAISNNNNNDDEWESGDYAQKLKAKIAKDIEIEMTKLGLTVQDFNTFSDENVTEFERTPGYEPNEEQSTEDKIVSLWQVTYDGNTGRVVKPPPEIVIASMIAEWASSSDSMCSRIIKESVAKQFDTTRGFARNDPYRRASLIPLLSETSQKVVDGFVKAQYNLTQKALKDAGIKTLSISRGYKNHDELQFLPDDFSKYRGTHEIVSDSISSWSGDLSVAFSFGTNGDESLSRSKVIVTTIPASRVFATPFTGYGSFLEKEIIPIWRKGDKALVFDFGEYTSYSDFAVSVKDALDKDLIPKLSKSDENNIIYLDEDIVNADWIKSMSKAQTVTKGESAH